MTDYSRKLLRILLTLVAIAALTYGFALFRTGRNLKHALERVPKPPSVAFHEQLYAARQRGSIGESAPTLARAAAFQSLFERLQGNASIRALREIEFDKAFDVRPFYASDTETQARCFEALAALRPEIETLRRLASEDGPHIVLDIEGTFGLNSDGFHDVWMCQSLLHMSMVAGVARGEGREAVADATALLQLAKLLAADPRLKSQLDRFRLVGRVFHSMQQHCPSRAFSDGELTSLLAALRGREDRDGVVNALSGERFLGLHSYGYMVKWVERNNARFAAYVSDGGGLAMDVAAKAYASPLFQPHHNNQKVQHAYLVGLAVQAGPLPYYQSKETWDRVEAGYEDGRHGLLHQMYRPYVGTLGRRQAGHESRVHLLRLALCLELYRRAHGAYPDELGEVAPLLPEGLPADPFCGTAYRYSRGEEVGFMLYGVGWNLVDDGGVVGEYGEGDMVWDGVSKGT